MGQISRNDTKSTATAFQEVDLDKLSDAPEGQVLHHDTTEADDAWGFGALPPKGRYNLRLGLPKEAPVKYNTDDEYYVLGLECRIVGSDNGECDNIPVFAGVSSKIGRGKSISPMAALLYKMGVKVPDQVSDKQLVQMWVKFLQGDRICRDCLLDWNGGYKRNNGDWENVFSTMDEFPTKSDGQYDSNPLIPSRDGGSVKVRAMLRVVEWGNLQAGTGKEGNEGKENKGKNITTSQPVKTVEAPKQAPSFMKASTGQGVQAQSSQSSTHVPEVHVQDDLEFMVDDTK